MRNFARRLLNGSKSAVSTIAATPKAVLALMVAAFGVGSTALAAGATAYNPTTALTSLANGVTSTASPIIVDVAVAFIPFLIVLWVVGMVFTKLRHRGA